MSRAIIRKAMMSGIFAVSLILGILLIAVRAAGIEPEVSQDQLKDSRVLQMDG